MLKPEVNMRRRVATVLLSSPYMRICAPDSALPIALAWSLCTSRSASMRSFDSSRKAADSLYFLSASALASSPVASA